MLDHPPSVRLLSPTAGKLADGLLEVQSAHPPDPKPDPLDPVHTSTLPNNAPYSSRSMGFTCVVLMKAFAFAATSAPSMRR